LAPTSSTTRASNSSSYNVEPFRIETVDETPHASLARFDHPEGVPLPTAFSAHQAAERYRINVVERGGFRLKYGRREWTLIGGDVFLSRPNDEYRYAHVAHAAPDACLRLEFSHALAPELARALDPLPLVLRATNRLAFLQVQLRAIADHDADSALDSLASELVDAAVHSTSDDRRLYRRRQLRWYAERIVAARDFMRREPGRKHSLWDLASGVSMSPFLFARVFRELIGVPPHKYLVRVRLERAGELLESGMSVTQTCQAAGFNNLSHFIRTFRAVFGVRPSAAKAMRRANTLDAR